MKLIINFALGLAILVSGVSTVQADVVVSNAIEDLNHLGGNASNRNEMILNNSGSNTGRFGAVRFDINVLNTATNGGKAFTNAAAYTLNSASIRLTEEFGRNANNAAQSGRVGAYFLNTTENSEWTVKSAASVNAGNAGPDSGTPGDGWFGNSLARPGNIGGGGTGANNADNRSNGAANPLASFWDGTSFVNHIFDAGNSSEFVDIDLTLGGASLLDIQSILNDWVNGSNAGIGFGAEFGNQSFWQSNSIDEGVSVVSTIDGNNAFSGLSIDNSGGSPPGLDGFNGPGTGTISLTLNFSAVPEPSSLTLLGLVGLGLVARRRK